MKYTIEVTQEDIDEGISFLCDACPVALAMRRAMGKEIFISPDAWGLTRNSNDPTDQPLPSEAKHFILDFDSGAPVKPFTFTIEL